MIGFYVIAAIAAIIPFISLIDLLWFLVSHERCFRRLKEAIPAVAMIAPICVLVIDSAEKNDCCGDSAIFSPEHRLTAIVLVGLSISAFFYSVYRRKLAPPLLEVIVDCLLILGIGFDIFVGIQMNEIRYWYFGIAPVALQFLLALAENHQLALAEMNKDEIPAEKKLMTLCRKIVRLPSWQKFPLLLLLCLPVLTLLVAVLLLFGQKPDSLVRVFTDTYKHSFSTLDYQCAGVVCGGHFLCTIAARGTPGLVKPIRIGVRAGRLIQCNRQLLVSNAFEELLEQKLPWLHRPIRTLYNKVGDGIHRYYGVFDRPWVSNSIYLLMKPLEWIFLLVLYLADRKPETRIAQQYFHRDHRRLIHNHN